jgi:hypothetical protein
MASIFYTAENGGISFDRSLALAPEIQFEPYGGHYQNFVPTPPTYEISSYPPPGHQPEVHETPYAEHDELYKMYKQCMSYSPHTPAYVPQDPSFANGPPPQMPVYNYDPISEAYGNYPPAYH